MNLKYLIYDVDSAQCKFAELSREWIFKASLSLFDFGFQWHLLPLWWWSNLRIHFHLRLNVPDFMSLLIAHHMSYTARPFQNYPGNDSHHCLILSNLQLQWPFEESRMFKCFIKWAVMRDKRERQLRQRWKATRCLKSHREAVLSHILSNVWDELTRDVMGALIAQSVHTHVSNGWMMMKATFISFDKLAVWRKDSKE